MKGIPATSFKYDNSNIDIYLENEFYNFLSPIHENILKTSIIISSEADGFKRYEIERNVFLASPLELGFSQGLEGWGTKIEYFSSNLERRASGDRPDWYTREYRYNVSTPSFKRITSTGGFDTQTMGYSGIRPFFCLKNSVMVSPDPNPDGSYNLIL